MSELTPGWIINVTEANFQKEVLEASKDKPVIVDFWAPWCEPCTQLTPIIEKIVNEKKGKVILAKINVDESPKLAQQFQIEGIPAIRIIRQGRLLGGFEGVRPEEQLRELFEQLAPPDAAERELAQAKKLERTQPVQAEAIYRKVLEKQPERPEAQLGIVRTLVEQKKTEEATTYLDSLTLEGDASEEAEKIRAGMFFRTLATSDLDEVALRQQIDGDPKAAQACFDLGCLLAARGKLEDALPLLLQAGERDFNLANSKVREVMVKIFYALGANHPLANEYRAKLATLLY
jgi:putative thioredoxin